MPNTSRLLHPTRFRCRLLLALAALAAAPACATAADSATQVSATPLFGYRGEARALDGSGLLYVEEHLLRGDAASPSERLVLYRCADGTAFARKRVDYAPAALAPDFELRDARLDYREGLRREGGQLIAFAGDAATVRERGLAQAPDLVADSGFDRLVRQRWDALQAGEDVRIDFLVPSRGQALDFRVRKVESLSVDGAPASRFRLSVGGFIGLFAPAIDVVYRDADRWLLRFEGLTNIRAQRDENLEARIEFPQPPSPRGDALWREYSALELSACAVPPKAASASAAASAPSSLAQSRSSP